MVHRIKSKKFDCNIDNTGNCITSGTCKKHFNNFKSLMVMLK